MRNTRLFAVAFLVLIAARPSAGQVIDAPPGSVRSIFGGNRPVAPNSTSQRLSMDVDLSGGYDTNSETATTPLQDTFAGSARAGVQYWHGRNTRYLLASAEGGADYETTTRDDLISGEVLVEASTNVGRFLQVSGGGLVAYDPASLAAQFGPGFGEVAEPGLDYAPPSGVVEQPWLASSSYVNAVRTWSAQHLTSIEYRTSRRDQRNLVGLESLSHQASLVHDWRFRPGGAVSVSYQFDHHREQTEELSTPPLRTSTIEAGLRLQRRYSPIRTLTANVSAGASRAVRTVSNVAVLDDFLPVASGFLGFVLTDVWSFSVDGSHYVSVIEGVTAEAFATTSGNLQVNAAVSRRVTLSLSGTYSRGAGLRTRSGDFETTQGMAQVAYGFGPRCGIFGSYTFYNHQLNDLALIPVGFPEQYTRGSARIGLTLWLPLFGAF